MSIQLSLLQISSIYLLQREHSYHHQGYKTTKRTRFQELIKFQPELIHKKCIFRSLCRLKNQNQDREREPLPEIALRLGWDGTPEAIHICTERLDLADISSNQRRLFIRRPRDDGARRRKRRGRCRGELEALEPLQSISDLQRHPLGTGVELRQISAAAFHRRRRRCRPPEYICVLSWILVSKLLLSKI